MNCSKALLDTINVTLDLHLDLGEKTAIPSSQYLKNSIFGQSRFILFHPIPWLKKEEDKELGDCRHVCRQNELLPARQKLFASKCTAVFKNIWISVVLLTNRLMFIKRKRNTCTKQIWEAPFIHPQSTGEQGYKMWQKEWILASHWPTFVRVPRISCCHFGKGIRAMTHHTNE